MEMDDLDGGTAQPQRLPKLEQNKDVIKEANISNLPLAYLLVVYRVSAAIFNTIFESLITTFFLLFISEFSHSSEYIPVYFLACVISQTVSVQRSPGIIK